MDGYSVNEAATVLGIPEGRVWELLARGVLVGWSEVGGDMRVFLRGAAVAEVAKGTNGGPNGSSGGELSPFRELLTEFRNLTERYGQALLALGESRGEVAALRGRVELLEARVELRMPRAEAPVSDWEPGSGTLVRIDSEVAPGSASGAAPRAGAAAEDSAPPRRVRGTGSRSARPTVGRKATRSRSRAAVSGFADALARAEDPSASTVGSDESSLPGADEAAQALAAYRQQVGLSLGEPANQEAATAEPLATESAAAQPPPAEPAASPPARAVFARPGYSTETPEPDWIAEEDLVVPHAAPTAPQLDVETAPAMATTADEGAGPEVEPAPDVQTGAAEPSETAPSQADVAAELPDITAEPPAADDIALLAEPFDFSEPPIVPREPAFWEPEGRAQAPFAVPNLENWEPADLEVLRAELTRVAPVPAEPAAPAEPPPVSSPPVTGSTAAEQPPPEPTLTARRQPPRGPAARAVRRLRRLLG